MCVNDLLNKCKWHTTKNTEAKCLLILAAAVNCQFFLQQQRCDALLAVNGGVIQWLRALLCQSLGMQAKRPYTYNICMIRSYFFLNYRSLSFIQLHYRELCKTVNHDNVCLSVSNQEEIIFFLFVNKLRLP